MIFLKHKNNYTAMF